jgi:hypothetical protein
MKCILTFHQNCIFESSSVNVKSTKLLIDYEYDFEVLGIVSSVKDYTLAWHINQLFGIKLVREKDLEFEPKKDSNFRITNFVFATEYSTFRLLKNLAAEYINTSKPFLLPEKKQYDYIVTFDGDFAESYESLLDKLRFLQVAQLVDRFDVSYLTSKENLLL